MSRLKFLLMALCLALGGLFLWKSEQGAAPASGAKDISLMSDLKIDQVRRISVVRPGDPYDLERTESGKWELRHPQEAPADNKTAAALLKGISSLKARNVIEGKELDANRAVYGLSPPELALVIEGDFGKRTLSFGKKVAASGRRYLQIEGEERIVLVDESGFGAANVGLEQMRDHYPLKLDREKVSELIVSRGENDTLQFTRGDGWTVKTPSGEMAADAEAVQTELDKLAKLRVKTFIDETDAKLDAFGLAEPAVIIQIRYADEANAPDITLQAGERGSSSGRAVFFRIIGQPFVYEARGPFYNALLQPADYFRPREPLRFLSDAAVERIESGIGSAGFSLVAAEGGWKLEAPGAATASVDAESVKTWLEAAAALRVISYPGEETIESGLQNSASQFKIFVKGRGAPISLTLGAPLLAPGKTEPGSDTPFWARVTQEDGAELAAVIDAESHTALKQGREFFTKEK